MTDSSIPVLDDVMQFPDEQEDGDRRWIVLYDQDYDNVIIDPEGNVGVLVGIEQAGEVYRLAAQVIASLSSRDADPEDPMREFIDELERIISDE